MFNDYYKLLKIHPGSNEQMIEDAYEAKVQQLSGDAASRHNNAALLDELKKAYKILMNVPSRVEYDQRWLSMNERRTGFIPDGSPKIHYLRSSKYQYEINDEITISWDTSNCDVAILYPFGEVETSGNLTFKVEKNKFYFNIELVAKNTKQRTRVESSIRLNKSSTSFSSRKNNYMPPPEKNIDFSNVKRSGNKFRKPVVEANESINSKISNEIINPLIEESIIQKLKQAIAKWFK